MNPQVLLPPQAAAYLGVTSSQLQKWRHDGIGPPFLPWGRRTIRYRVDDLDKWLRSQCSVLNTAEAAQHLRKVS